MKYCSNLLLTLYRHFISEKPDTRQFINEYLSTVEEEELFFQDLVQKGVPQDVLDKVKTKLTNYKLTQSPEVNTPQDTSIQENVNTDTIEIKSEFIDRNYSFNSKSEALRKLFQGKDHLLLRYERFASKYLIKRLFLNPNFQVTDNTQIKNQLSLMINEFSRVLIGKPLLNIDSISTTLTHKNTLYELNAQINKILGDPSKLENLKNLLPGKNIDKDTQQVFAAISYANFNTILKEYLPGVLTINSHIAGFDVNNLNNENLFSINSGTQHKGWSDAEKIIDTNSNLAKLLLHSFDNLVAYRKGSKIHIKLSDKPLFQLANYYYVGQILSQNLSNENYTNELNQLLTALMQYKVTDQKGESRIKQIENDSQLKNTIGKFNTEYITKEHPELEALLKESTHFSTIATLYYNIALTDNDVVFSVNSYGIPKATLDQKFSLAKYYNKHSKTENFSKQNLHSLIFSTFFGNARRAFHDITYDANKKQIISMPLSQRNINKSAFKLQKSHRNLRGFRPEIEKLFIKSFDDRSITLIHNNKTYKYEFNEKQWLNVYNLSQDQENQIYEVLAQLTRIDLRDDLLLANADVFSFSNILSVIYAMVKLNAEDEKDKTPLLSSKKALGDAWKKYAPNKEYNINNILYGMGVQYGLVNGVYSKMTVLSKEGKQLPTFGNVNIVYRYNGIISKLQNKASESNYFQNNLFVLNPSLIKGVSQKNQISNNGAINDYKSQNEKDQFLVDVFYEWFQRRRSYTVQKNEQTDTSINNDGTTHFQPIVYADKTQQIVIKIDTTGNISYWDKNGDKPSINPFDLNTFNTSVLTKLKEASFYTIGSQHLARQITIQKAYVRVLQQLKYNLTDEKQVNDYIRANQENMIEVTQPIELLFKEVMLLRGDRSLEELFHTFNSNEPLTNNLFFEKDKEKVYKLNNTQLFYFDMFSSPEYYYKYQNLAILESFYEYSKMNIDQGSDNLKLFPNKDANDHLIKNFNKINDPNVKKELKSIMDHLLGLNKLKLNKLKAPYNYDKLSIQNKNLQTTVDTYGIIKDGTLDTLIFSSDPEVLQLHDRIAKQIDSGSSILQQYFWEKELFGQNFELSINGPIYLHPAKGKSNTVYSDILLRLAASQKRNVPHQSTVIPYTPNEINGKGPRRTVLVIKEPKTTVSNPLGEVKALDSHDGGEHILLLQRILENNSMQGFSNPIHHKALIQGRTMTRDGQFRESLLFKYASYAIGNQRLRDSQNYRNIIKYALSQPIPFSDKKTIDFTLDFNGLPIDYYKLNVVFETETGYRQLIKLEKTETGYQTTYKDYIITQEKGVKQLQTVVLGPTEVQIQNLYDLYEIFGAHMTVDAQGTKIKNNNNKSWEALQDIVNRVGFRLTPENFFTQNNGDSIQLEYSRLSGHTIKELFSAQNNIVENQLNIVQPLKFAFISNFTPESCIKFGATPGVSIDSFKTDLTGQDLPLMYVYDMLQGVQQDSEHEGEESTEPTQMINGVSLDNLSPEKLQLYRYIAEFIEKNMNKSYPDKQTYIGSEMFKSTDVFLNHMRQLSFIYNKLQVQVLNSAYDNGQTASLILTTVDFAEKFIRMDREIKDDNEKMEAAAKLLENTFHISLSHASVFKTFVTTLSALNTKIGIRRSGAGMSNVLTPHEGYETFVEIPTIESLLHKNEKSFYLNNRDYKLSNNPDVVYNYTSYTAMTPDRFKQVLKENPIYQELLDPDNRYTTVYDESGEFDEFNIGAFKHYIVTYDNNQIEQIYVDGYPSLKTLKSELYNGKIKNILLDNLSGFDWTNNAGRHLKPMDFEITVKNAEGVKRIYNIYDCFSTELLYELNSNIVNINTVKAKLKNKKFEILSNLNIDDLDFRELNNVLRNTLNYEQQLISKKQRLSTEEDVLFLNLKGIKNKFTQADLQNVVDVRHIDFEMIANHPQNYKFGVTNRMHISNVTFESILTELNKQVGEVDEIKLKTPNGATYTIPQYFLQENGNIYLFESDKVAQDLIPLPESYIFTDEDGKRFVAFESDKPLIEITDSDLESQLFVFETSNGPKLMIRYTPKQWEITNYWGNIIQNINKCNGRDLVFIRNDFKWGKLELSEKDEMEGNFSKATLLLTHFDAIDKYDCLNDSEDQNDVWYYKKAKALARSKYSAFQMGLRFASSRIPGQSYQSFSSSRIVNFLHDESNAMLVNAYNIWLTGGDYDIDKLYSIGFNLTKSGKFIGWNPFFNDNTYEHLLQSIKLPGQDTEIKFQTKEVTTAIDLDKITFKIKNDVGGLEDITGYKLLNQVMAYNKNINKYKPLTNIRLSVFQQFVELYNLLAEHGCLIPEDETKAIEIRKKLDIMEAHNYQSIDNAKALQNRITLGCRTNFNDFRNIAASYAPISIDGPSTLKNNAPAQESAMSIHPNTLTKQAKDVFNQYAGKSVVGIMAAGLKLYATISYVVEDITYKRKSAGELKQMLFNQKLFVGLDENNEPKISVTNGFAGIQYNLTPESKLLLRDQLLGLNPDVSVEAMTKYVEDQIQQHYKKDSVQLQISQMLSAATDNGKEMILGIINSGLDTQGIYVYSLMLGYPLETIGKIMTSPGINFILNQIKRSILLDEPYKNIIDVAGYFINGVALEDFLPQGATNNVISMFPEGSFQKEKSLDDIQKDIETRKSSLRTVPVRYMSEYEFDQGLDEFAETFDAYSCLQNWLNVSRELEILASDKQNVEYVKMFLHLQDAASLTAQTTQVLGANQRVKATEREILKFYIAFEDVIRNYLNVVKTNNKFSISGPYNQTENLEGYFEILSHFSMHKFFSDENYAELTIDAFDHVKRDLNPLRILYNAEHFKEMIRTSLNTDLILAKNSVVYRTLKNILTNRIADLYNEKKKTQVNYAKSMTILNDKNEVIGEVPGEVIGLSKKDVIDRSISESTFKVLKNIIDDIYVHNTLSALQKELGTDVQIKVDNKVKTMNLSTTSSRKEFIEFMEKSLIPSLLQGVINPDETTDELTKEKLKSNLFLKQFGIEDFNIVNKANQNFEAYGVQTFKSSDNPTMKFNQNELIVELYKLENLSYKATPQSKPILLIDLLFLYNTIIHRGRDGESTLSSFFDPNKIPGSIMNKYYDQANRVNNEVESMTVNVRDLGSNGFDSELDYKISIPSTFTEDYKYINVQNIQDKVSKEKTKVKTLEEMLNDIFDKGFNNQIKFNCI